MPETVISPAVRPVEPPVLRTTIAALARRFSDAGIATPEIDARSVVLNACCLSLESYLLSPDRPLNAVEARSIEVCGERRLAGEPVSRILGKRAFWANEYRIGPAVLDPRQDTETLIEAALGLLEEEGRRGQAMRIIDLGTGSGCVLLSLLAELPEAWGVGTDLDPAALRIARENAGDRTLKSRCAFVCNDWSAAVGGEFDVILVNPPYIKRDDIARLAAEVRHFDPPLALDGGLDGLDAYRSIAQGCRSLAKAGSWILLEVGMGQTAEIVRIFRKAGWCDSEKAVRSYADLAGVNRVVAIKRQTAAC
jgi:release factor glutamine methyltransferase